MIGFPLHGASTRTRAWLAAMILSASLGACAESAPSPPDVDDDAGRRMDGSVGPERDAGRPTDAARDARTADAAEREDVDASAAFYGRDHVLQVDVTLAAEDWERIRNEGRSLADVYTGCAFSQPFEYTSVEAKVTIDGRTFDRVAVRKKGFIGSLSSVNPSLRIDLGEYVKDQNLYGDEIVTLNNALTDNARVRQCLAYDVFRRAGQPAPRCNFAKVKVNGVELGTYVHVEAVKKPFLRRTFGDDDGDLYEGVMGDFRPDRLGFLEKKTNEDEPPSPELAAVTAALEKPDAELLAALEPLIDLEAFYEYWAIEALINHEDSYSGNQNNFFVYVHPTTRKLHFIPWGTDGTFGADTNVMVGRPQSVYATARLTRRLYANAAAQEKYRATLRRLLDEHWDEAVLAKDLDSMAATVGDAAHQSGLTQLREFVRGRGAALRAELDAPAKPWPFEERGELRCDPSRRSPIEGTFLSSWETSAQFPTIAVENAVKLELKDAPLATLLTMTSAGPTPDGRLAITHVMLQLDGSTAVVQLLTTRKELTVGALPFHGFETFGVVLRGPSADQLKIIGFFSDGSIEFDKVGMKAGDAVAGRFRGIFTNNEPWR